MGSGDDVVLILPGGPGYPAATMEIDAELISDAYQVVLIDPPGTGTTPGLTGAHHPARVADFYAAACSALGIRNCAVVGWSFGGLVGVYLAAKQSELVRQLVLVSSNVMGTEVEPDPDASTYREEMLARHRCRSWFPHAKAVFDMWTELALAPTATAEGLRELNIAIHPLYLSDPSNETVRQRLGRFEANLTVDVHAMKAWEAGQFQGLDARKEASALSIPVLVICGEHDWLAGPPFARATAEAFAHGTLAVLPDCGHMPSVEQPDAYRDLLLSWLSPS